MPSCRLNLTIEGMVSAAGNSVPNRHNLSACTGTDRIETLGINLQVLGHVLQIVERQVDAYHGYHFALRVAHRIGATHYPGLRTRVIQIRFAPPAAIVHKAILIPFHEGIVVLSATDITGEDTVVGDTAAAGFVEFSFGREIIGHESHCHTGGILNRAHDHACSRSYRVRVIDMALR